MHYYEIDIQFVKANTPSMFDSKIKFAMETAVEDYNIKSMLATNPKKILENWPSDQLTYKLFLRSRKELDNPTKALKIFSSFLKSEYLGQYEVGNRLFKMSAQEIFDYNDPEKASTPSDTPLQTVHTISKSEKEILSDIISVFYSTSPSDIMIKEKLINLYNDLTETPF